MKRGIAILLLTILIVSAIRPTVIAHYCGGTLQSVALAGEEITCSCGEMMEENASAGGVTLADPLSRCCTMHTFKISTDDFQLRPPLVVAAGFPVAIALPCPVAAGERPCSRSLLTLHAGAPGGKVLPTCTLLARLGVSRT